MFDQQEPTLIQELHDPLWSDKQIRLLIKRDDLIHPEISGNKWRKLKYNLIAAKEQNKDTLLTFGGAYSNHIYALAKAGEEYGFKTIGFIRGEEHVSLNPTLQSAKDWGMEFHYVNRSQYRNKSDEEFLSELKIQYPTAYIVPEGGTNEHALKGCTEMVDEIDIDFDVIACACGTGGTISGIIQGLNENQQALGIPVLKGAAFLIEEIKELTGTNENWELNPDYHFGGYARINDELLDFIRGFYEQHQILLDPVYTGKLLFAIFDLIRKDCFTPGSTIVAIHTGGLQGWNGFLTRGLIDKTYYENLHRTT